ncbi:MAG: hypothetical protein IKQ58_06745, partial [Prevotella sp.]|nr:hypothetical protein [Prevotella sp.]
PISGVRKMVTCQYKAAGYTKKGSGFCFADLGQQSKWRLQARRLAAPNWADGGSKCSRRRRDADAHKRTIHRNKLEMKDLLESEGL